jgi:glycosyltransferase involved in cell wall biosynthesis
LYEEFRYTPSFSMRILIHAAAAKIGGAGTYIRTLARELAQHSEHDYLFLVPEAQADAIRGIAPHISVLTNNLGGLRRLWFDQMELPRILRRERIDVLFSSANFGTFFCPCRQLLLTRNSLYFSKIYRDRILPHKNFPTRLGESLRRFLARRSARVADVVITPSEAMLYELHAAGVPVRAAHVNHYGVDRQRFRPELRPFAPHGKVRLLFTSLYAEHKNLGTLFRALLRLNAAGHKSFLITTSDPAWEDIHNPIRKADRALAHDLKSRGLLELTGVLAGADLDQLYGRADIFVYPSVVESFGHPLLEAMASGLPIVAADVPVNRELCGEAAVYFSPFDEADCARQISAVIGDAELRAKLSRNALGRVEAFSWKTHIAVLLGALSGHAEAVDEPNAVTVA